jgi:hypothetical protein
MTDRKRATRWLVSFGSGILRGRDERSRAKRDLRRGIEPAPRYTTGKFWMD